MKPRFRRQFGLLARRSVKTTFRNPGTVGPAIAIPLLLYIVISSGLDNAVDVPDFPTDSFATFALTLAFANGALTMVGSTGAAVATDIESGFINRLALTPIRGVALLFAQLAGPFILGLIQAAIYFGVGYAFGARVFNGWEGALVLTGLFLTGVIGFGMAGIFLGLRTGSAVAVQAIAPVLTVFMFLSSINFPRNLMDSEWFKWIATVNPLSYFVEGMRSLLIEDWNREAMLLCLVFTVSLTVISLTLAVWTLRRRLVRT